MLPGLSLCSVVIKRILAKAVLLERNLGRLSHSYAYRLRKRGLKGQVLAWDSLSTYLGINKASPSSCSGLVGVGAS